MMAAGIAGGRNFAKQLACFIKNPEE